MDLFVCQDGFGSLDTPQSSVVDITIFEEGLYRCGKALKSTNAGLTCSSYLDCPTSTNSIYASCKCTYADT
jgi:hypothetical protein